MGGRELKLGGTEMFEREKVGEGNEKNDGLQHVGRRERMSDHG
jgi:hypothetical protein